MPSPLTKLAAFTPGSVFPCTSPIIPNLHTSIVVVVVSAFFALSIAFLHDLSNRNQVTHFLVSAPFVEVHTLLYSFSLFKHPNQSLLERAGLRFNSRYDLNHPVSLLSMPPPPATCACFPLSGDQRNPTVLFTASLCLCPLPGHSRFRTA